MFTPFCTFDLSHQFWSSQWIRSTHIT